VSVVVAPGQIEAEAGTMVGFGGVGLTVIVALFGPQLRINHPKMTSTAVAVIVAVIGVEPVFTAVKGGILLPVPLVPKPIF